MTPDLNEKEWSDLINNRYPRVVEALVNAKDKGHGGDGGGLLPGSIGRQLGNVAKAIKANEPDDLVAAVKDQNAIIGELRSAIPKSANTIADSQKAAAERIAEAIGHSTDCLSGEAQQAATVTINEKIVTLFAIGLDPTGRFNPDNEAGQWFLLNKFETIHDVCKVRRRDFVPRMDRNRVAPGNALVDELSIEELKTVHDVACGVSKKLTQ